MKKRIALDGDELALVLEALEDAAYFRETHSRVLHTAVGRRGGEFTLDDAPSEAHRDKSRAYADLADKLAHLRDAAR